MRLAESIYTNLKEEEKPHTFGFKSNKVGECPVCGEQDLDYQELQPEDNMVCYPWHCDNCGAEGNEWYDLTFTGHYVDKGLKYGMVEVSDEVYPEE